MTRRRRKRGAAVLALLGLAGTWAAARPVAVGGAVQAAAVETRTLPGGGEALAVWTLPRLGVAVRNDPQDVRLRYGERELRHAPGTGWRAVGFTLPGGTGLAAPQAMGPSLYVPLAALRLLGVPVTADTPSLLGFAAPATVPEETLPPSPDLPAADPAPVPLALPPLANLDTVRVGRSVYRTVEVQRVVLELSAAAPHSVVRESGGLSVVLPRVTGSASQTALRSGDLLRVDPAGDGVQVHLQTGGGTSEIFTLEDPYRVVIDTTTHLDARVPPPINPEALPEGVTYRTRGGGLHLLSFDPARFQPRVVTAPVGAARDVAALVKAAGGVAGVNGGYFDPASSLPVDLVAVGGLLTAGSLEKRAAVGFTPQGTPLFGYPRPRYVVGGDFGSLTVNGVGAKARPTLLTAFVGDGATRVGAEGLTTLWAEGGRVSRAASGPVVPPRGVLALTFDPARFPALPRTPGTRLTVSVNWQATDAPWERAQDALAAGPLLVQGGRVVLDPKREAFDTGASIWRATRQVAFGVLEGQPTVAYLEHGTPETFAAALAGAGVRDAVRLDSGSSATAFVTGGYAGLGGYLNTVWSRPVPNAIVFVPKVTGARK
ncbi:phosphodiester glycosidase family protein [Deinococcus terrestris]|uniref:phosphodiester glycosidase family protein n=1 Tax=Deinococcus terrestris TaxID=2651870 RepID=UPI002AD39910|nr:phosphodiester glycosidase family protein [Deinococcus terrestris]